MSIRYASYGYSMLERSLRNSIREPWFRDGGNLLRQSDGAAFSIAYPATTHTKGSWTQLIASTAANTSLLRFYMQGLAAAATDTATLVDIGIGAAGSETVIVPDLAVGGHSILEINVPVAIPSGSRVALRFQGNRTAPAVLSSGVAVFSGDGYQLLPASVDVLGVTTATSVGTAMSGASGSWVQLIASTETDYQQVIVVPSLSTTDAANITVSYELGIGASGSERVIGSQLLRYNSSEAAATSNPIFPIPLSGRPVPAGSRLAVRHNIAANPDRYDVCLIGVPYV